MFVCILIVPSKKNPVFNFNNSYQLNFFLKYFFPLKFSPIQNLYFILSFSSFWRRFSTLSISVAPILPFPNASQFGKQCALLESDREILSFIQDSLFLYLPLLDAHFDFFFFFFWFGDFIKNVISH